MRDVQILVLEQKLQIVFGEMSDLRVLHQKSKVLADETKELCVHLLHFELKRDVDRIAFIFRNVKVIYGKQLDRLLLGADH